MVIYGSPLFIFFFLVSSQEEDKTTAVFRALASMPPTKTSARRNHPTNVPVSAAHMTRINGRRGNKPGRLVASMGTRTFRQGTLGCSLKRKPEKVAHRARGRACDRARNEKRPSTRNWRSGRCSKNARFCSFPTQPYIREHDTFPITMRGGAHPYRYPRDVDGR